MVIFPSILKFVCVVSNLVFLLLTLLYQTRQELFAHLGLPKFEIFENFLPCQRLFTAAIPRLLQNPLTFQQFVRKTAQYRLKNRFFY